MFHGNLPRGVYFAVGIDLDLISFRSLKYRPRCNDFFVANLLSHFDGRLASGGFSGNRCFGVRIVIPTIAVYNVIHNTPVG